VRVLRRSARPRRMLHARHELDMAADGCSAPTLGKRIFIGAAAVDHRHRNVQQAQVHR
jgi:hypothetical protein